MNECFAAAWNADTQQTHGSRGTRRGTHSGNPKSCGHYLPVRR
jgi:hypothetical protein